MAFNDTLFQLGMDLTRSSTAQKEDHRYVTLVEPRNAEVRSDMQGERETARHAGHHVIVDLHGGKRLGDEDYVAQTLRRCSDAAGSTLLHIHVHNSPATGGVTGVAVLSGGHINVHSWPEAGFAAFDVFMSGEAKPYACIDELRAAFDPRDVVVKTHQREAQVFADPARRPAELRKSQPVGMRSVRKAKAA